MSLSFLDLAPFTPSDAALAKSPLPDKALELHRLAARLAGQLAPVTLNTIIRHMAVINSYYSNLIEGNPTHPYDIRAALRHDYSRDTAKRDLQLESVAHIEVQQWIHKQSLDLDSVFSLEFIRNIHKEFYLKIPETLWRVKNSQGEIIDKVEPGMWRRKQVIVGSHLPPAPEDLDNLLQRFCEHYRSGIFSGDRKIIAILAAHHRFVWIHPFLDGNGRVGRLLTDAALKAVGLDSYGAWCLSRGIAKTASQYKQLLANADAPRQGDYDGRGALTEKGLTDFCDYLLDCAIDQVEYIHELLDLQKFSHRLHHYIQARNDGRVKGVSTALKASAHGVLFSAFMLGEVERAQALNLCAMPERSARRLLSQLKDEGLLSEVSSKSALRWEIPEHAEPWYFPNLVGFA